MTQIGPSGADAPAVMDGVPYDIWEGIQARAGTWLGREPYRPVFGLGLEDGLGNPSPTPAEWDARLRASFASLAAIDLEATRISVAGGRVQLLVSLDEA